MNAPFYQHHVFFCVNERLDKSRPSCANCGAKQGYAYAKERVSDLGLAGAGRIRINQAGCLNRCRQGPVAVVYPQGVWYRYTSQSDLDEIIDLHLIGGRAVVRLLLDPS